MSTNKPFVITDTQAMDRIQDILSGSEWNMNLVDEVAAVVRLTGRVVRDSGDEEEAPQYPATAEGELQRQAAFTAEYSRQTDAWERCGDPDEAP